MRVLIISTVPYQLNGISVVVRNLYQNDAFSKDEVTVAIPTCSDANMVEELRKCGHRILFYDQNTRLHNPLTYTKFLTAHMRENAYDLVHIHGNSHTVAFELLAAKRAKCKVRMVHAHSTSCNSIRLHKLLNPIFRRLYTHGLACGQKAGEFMFGPKTDFMIINNAINTTRFAFSEFARQDIRSRYEIGDRVVIGHVGSFCEVKNQSFLIDVLEQFSKEPPQKYMLMLLGDGDLLESVKQKALERGVSNQVIFVGSTPDVPLYLSACDMIMMPSFYEGLPLTLIEEQANGLYCLASDRITSEANKTGNVQFLSIDTGVDPWVNAAKSLDLHENRIETSAAAIQKIKENNYDIEEEVKKLHNFYQTQIQNAKN